MTDPQIEAAAEAAWRAAYHWPKGWDEVAVGDRDHWRKIARAALEALKGRWFSDEESGYENPDDAADAYGLTLGQSIVLSENATLAEERWQLVPVTDTGELCPCGKPEGCGDSLGMKCEAVRDEVRRWSELPKEWQR